MSGLISRQEQSIAGEDGATELPEWEIWACAQAVERQYGEDGPRHIAERIGELALAGDVAGIATWKRIAAAFDAVRNEGKTKQ